MEHAVDKLDSIEDYKEKYPYSSKVDKSNLEPLLAFDYVVVLVPAAVILCVSCYGYWERHILLKDDVTSTKTTTVSLIPAMMSQSLSFLSSISSMGIPSEIYFRSLIDVWVLVGEIVGTAIAGKLFIPIYFKLGLKSTHQYLALRFGTRTQLIFATLYIIKQVLYVQVVLSSCKAILKAVGGSALRLDFDIICFLYVICIAMGGINSIVWADAVNMVIMIFGLTLSVLKSDLFYSKHSHFNFFYKTGRLDFATADFNPYVVPALWSNFLGHSLLSLSITSCSQSNAQRCLFAKNLRHAKNMIFGSIGYRLVLGVLFYLLGFSIAAFYSYCDPLIGIPKVSVKVMHSYTQDIGHTFQGFGGLICIVMIAAAVSTFGSEIVSVSEVFMYDMFQNLEGLNNSHKNRLGQLMCLVFGFFSILMQLSPSTVISDFEAGIAANGFIIGSFLGVFTMGILIPHANAVGAIVGLMSSLVILTTNYFGLAVHVPLGYITSDTACNGTTLPIFNSSSTNQTIFYFHESDKKRNWFSFSFHYYTVLAFLLSFIIGVAVSFLSGPNKPKDFDPRLTYPLFDKVYPFKLLPERIRDRLRFGIDYSVLNTIETGIKPQQTMSELNPRLSAFLGSRIVNREPETLDDHFNEENLACLEKIGFSSPVDKEFHPSKAEPSSVTEIFTTAHKEIF